MAEDKKYAGIELNVPSAAAVDLAARHEAGYRPIVEKNTDNDILNPEKTVTPYAVEGNDTSAYLGTSPEYMNYATPGDQPHRVTEGAEADVLDYLQSGMPGVYKTQDVSDEVATQVGGQSVEHINTATSGEDFSSELVDKPEAPSGIGVIGAEPANSQAAGDSGNSTSKGSGAKATPAKPGPSSVAKSSS
jgi:hypothetical protein